MTSSLDWFLATLCLYAAVFFGVTLMGLLGARKKLHRFPLTKADFEELYKYPHSSWSPAGPVGNKRWRNILFILFLILGIINFMTLN
jgi:hypothetical protein